MHRMRQDRASGSSWVAQTGRRPKCTEWSLGFGSLSTDALKILTDVIPASLNWTIQAGVGYTVLLKTGLQS